ncbi:MAG: ATPase [Deltaproteobacteria bacterium CG_4_9_14_3_um_filter_63_12]|nr:MAG: ATPase [Deltaproteobacteria bacterium CG17_big_fil_post_rev_8_21_14_2_50_63_7]PJB36389.1 MAG: ATPase [Deltaproteobacteria bacterium CG_4_9_14_3_um_filter_63_12]
MEKDVRVINELVRSESAFIEDVKLEVARVVVGQPHMVQAMMIGLLAGGHILLEGVPGLAKTLTCTTLADVVDAKFRRIQFTPDLLPADLIGTMIYRPETSQFEVRRGPIFANLVLADEINRAPAKVQSALLEAMQERQVTIGDQTYALEDPFLVMATQNPIEQEGTYPLPEAQVDRFMLMVKVSYPTREEERLIMDRMTDGERKKARQIVTVGQIMSARQVVNQVYVDSRIKDYIVEIVFATRAPAQYGLRDLEDMIEYGASPRASIYLNMAAKAHAFLNRRGYVTPEDIKAVGYDVLRHRVILSYEAEAEELNSEELLQRIFDVIEVP